MIHRRRVLQWVPVIVLIAGCSTLMGPRDPVQVQVVGVEPLGGEGLELRMLCKLRVQNPNDVPIEFNGIYLLFEVRGSAFATGLSDAVGTIPRFGEVVLSVPITVSALQLHRSGYVSYRCARRPHTSESTPGTIGQPGEKPQTLGNFRTPEAAIKYGRALGMRLAASLARMKTPT